MKWCSGPYSSRFDGERPFGVRRVGGVCVCVCARVCVCVCRNWVGWRRSVGQRSLEKIDVPYFSLLHVDTRSRFSIIPSFKTISWMRSSRFPLLFLPSGEYLVGPLFLLSCVAHTMLNEMGVRLCDGRCI